MNDTVLEPKSANSEDKLPASYSVDSLMEKLAVTASIKIWKTIDNIVYVQGIVGKVKIYRNIVYFDLKGSSTTISVKCALELSPIEGEYIIVEGLPIFKPSRFMTGLEIQIEGKPVANWEPRFIDGDASDINLQKPMFMKLNDCLAKNGINNFHLLGTETAIRDVVSQLPDDFSDLIQKSIIRVSEKSSMLADLQSVLYESCPFAIVRGGDDASLEVWNDPAVVKALLDYEAPFYVALGHTHCITLTTQYADESFHTPTALGSALNSTIQQIAYQQSLNNQISNLKTNELQIEKIMRR